MISWAAAREIAMKMGTALVISFATNVTTTTKSPVAKTTEKVERIKTTASGRATRMTTMMTTKTTTTTTVLAGAWRWYAVSDSLRLSILHIWLASYSENITSFAHTIACQSVYF